jgi:hypothetical protein
MMQNDKNRVVFILGSTGVGKTKVAEDIAVKILMDSFSETTNSESKKLKKKKSDDDDDDDDIDDQMVTIVNMDALQVHEELPIATARVLVEEKEEKKKTRGRWCTSCSGSLGLRRRRRRGRRRRQRQRKKTCGGFVHHF